MIGKVFLRANEDFKELSALANSSEGEGQSLNGAVGAQPVFGLHAGDDFQEFRSHPVSLSLKEIVDFFDEPWKWFIGIVGPVLREEVVEEDVDNDSGKATAFRSEEHFGF